MSVKKTTPPLCFAPLSAQWEGDGHLVVTGRTVGLSYASFYRACVDGLSGTDAMSWYLDPVTEVREPDFIFDQITDALLVAARRHHAEGTVAVLNHVRLVFHRGCRPPRDEFNARGRPRARLPVSPLPGGERGIRLRRRAIDDAIKWTSDRPCATEILTDWLSTGVTTPLASGGIVSIGDLARLIAKGGRRWWRTISGLGSRHAEKIDAWMRHRAQSLIARETSANVQEIRSRGQGVLQPFETFAVPDSIGGREGSNRRRHWYRPESIPAWADDRAALTAWLDMYRGNKSTYRSYLRKVERIWLWAVLVRGKAFSSLTTEDCIAYFQFLSDLPEDWVHSAWRGTARYDSEGWRPFASLVGPRSLDRHFSCTRSLFTDLEKWFYLDENPMRELQLCDIDGLQAIQSRSGAAWLATDPDHTFSAEQWSFLLRFAAEANSYPHEKRAVFVLRFCYHVGLRFSELWGRRVAHLMPPAIRSANGWRLKVVGPRQLARAADIPDPAFAILRQYMIDRGHPADPDKWDPAKPLVGQLDRGRGNETGEEASLDSINRSMKRFFRRAATAASALHPEWGDQIARASGLWLRASVVRHGMARGQSFVDLSRRLGYASVHTFEHFESPPVDRAASIRNWNRHLEETFRAAEDRCARRSVCDEKHSSGADADTHRRYLSDDLRK